jgi:naphthalene 1,2-dioxygenase system ferredoxin subunit
MNWVDAIALAAVPRDDVIGIEVAGRELALYGVDGAVYATDNRCTHGAARLCDGFVDGHTIECPLHQGRFDVRDGQPLGEPLDTPVRSYPVRIENGRVLVALE